MIRLGILSLVAVLGTASTSWASFDMLLLPGADGRLYRHDPANNVTLGSFAAGVDNLVVHDTAGNCYAGSSGSQSLRKASYSTGESGGSMSLSTTARSMNVEGNFLFYNSLTTARRHSLATGSSAGVVSLGSGVNWYSSATYGDSMQIIGVDTSTFTLSFQTMNLTDLSVSAVQSTATPAIVGTTVGKAAVAHNPFLGNNSLMFTYTVPASGNIFLARMALNHDGTFISTTISGSTLSGFSNASFMPAVVEGHNGWYVIGQDATNGALMRINQYEATSGAQLLQSYTITAPGGGFGIHPNGVYQPTNIVAPEPASMIALVSGVTGLIARRRTISR